MIKVIGRNNNWPASALACIGTNAVPALIELLTTNQTPDFYGDWRRDIPDNTVRENAILTLSMLGTNAQAALPLLLKSCKDENKKSQADMATALARIGHNQPEIIVPALTYLLTNFNRISTFSAPKALASFGSASRSALPALWVAERKADLNVKINIAVAIKQIAPETPDALSPLIIVLTNQDNSLRESVLYQLQSLGTNGQEAWATLQNFATAETNLDLRAQAIDCLAQVDTDTNALLQVAQINLTNNNDSVASAAFRCLAVARGNSMKGFSDLLLVYDSHPNIPAREQIESNIYLIMEKHPEYLVACLNSSQRQLSLAAMRYMDHIKRDHIVEVQKEPNIQYFTMAAIDDGDKKRLQDAVPILVEKLRDEDLATRKLATNVLLELNPKAAMKAGVKVLPPYSFYAY